MTDTVHTTILARPRSAKPGLWSLLNAEIFRRAAFIALIGSFFVRIMPTGG